MTISLSAPERTVTSIQCSLMRAVKNHRPKSEVEDLRRDLRAARMAEYISRRVAEAPPLTEAQKADLRALFDADS